MQVAITGKMASPINIRSWLLSHKKDGNDRIEDKGVRYLSKAVWRNIKILDIRTIQLI